MSKPPPKFFKIILSSQPSLRLPKKFVKDYGRSLPGIVSLEAPKGPVFQVELRTRSNGEIWLEKGFQDFKKYYSIGFGYFLVFTYNADFYFLVAIFDTTTTEIEYTPTKQKHQNVFGKPSTLKEARQIRSDDSIRNLSGIQRLQKGKRNEGNPVLKEVSVEMLDDVSTDILDEECNTSAGFCHRHQQQPISGSQQIVKEKEKEKFKGYRKAMAFKSRNPFVIAFMQRSYVSGSCQLSISPAFARNCLSGRKRRDVVLRVSAGRTWKVKCQIVYGNTRLLWKKFVEDNGIQFGDACIFECKNKTKCRIWDVITFRTVIEDAGDSAKKEESDDELVRERGPKL